MAGVTSSLGLLASSYEEEEAAAAPAAASGSTVLVVNAAPTVLVEYGGAGTSKAPIFKMEEDAKHGQLVMKSNPEYEDMWAPEQGPTLDPAAQRAAGIKSKHRFVGHVARYEPATHFAFEEQYHTFNAFGFASDPSTGAGPSGQNDVLGPQQAAVAGIVGDIERWAEARGESVFTRKEPLDSKLEAQRKRLRLDENYDQIPTSAPELTAEQKAAIDARLKQEKRRYEGREEEGDKPNMEEKAIFHGGSMTDYQGRSWLTPPTDVKEEEHECFIPKTWLHTWSGHTKGVAAIRWVPPVGHMLLSAGMDSKVKIWDVFNSRKCMQTYQGHSAAVRDICLTNDGRRFLTCSYDRYMKLWDTETGQCISAFTNRKLCYCVKFNPDPALQNVFLAGCSNKHVVQYDTNTGKVEQIYDQHLAAVNTITFVDDNKRFASTADDKKMLIWEWGIPVPIKHIADPTLHSMPAVTKTPNDKWMLCQNLDNQITCYGATDRFKLNRKKVFKGHIVAGYACQVGVSSDGNWVMSGDSEGRLWFWDWKSCKVFRKIKCHDQVCIGAIWHPIESSRVATCSWDGTIKYWD